MPPALAFLNPRLTTDNAGDIFIAEGAKRILAHDPERSIDVDPRRPVSLADLERVNACDAAVILGTSLWLRELRAPGRWTLTVEDLKRIRVPIIPLGVGTSRRFDEDDGFTPETLAIIRHVHESCALGSARDRRTAEALAAAGIRNVAMTGCPTLFRSLSPVWTLRRREPASRRVAVTLRAGQRRNARILIGVLARLGLEPVIAAQKPRDVPPRSLLGFGRGPLPPAVHARESGPYRELVETSAGAVGWRLHGNLLHLAEGNPAVFFANNSRAGSFCETFGLPCVRAPDRTRIPAAEIAAHARRLLDPETFAAFPARYAEAYVEMRSFLEKNGLGHRLLAVEPGNARPG